MLFVITSVIVLQPLTRALSSVVTGYVVIPATHALVVSALSPNTNATTRMTVWIKVMKKTARKVEH